MIDVNKTYRVRLKEAMEDAGLSVYEVCDRAGLSVTSVYRIMAKDYPNGQITTLLLLCDAIGIGIEELVVRCE